MTDWPKVLAPMEQALEQMIAETAPPEALSGEPPLSGAVPLLDEVLAPAARALTVAEEHARAVEMHVEDAVAALAAWRDRAAKLRRMIIATREAAATRP